MNDSTGYYEKLRQHRDSRHHPEPPLWPTLDLDLADGTRLLPVVERERAAHRAAVADEAARLDPPRFPWGLAFVNIALIVGMIVVVVALLGLLAGCKPSGGQSTTPPTIATCEEDQSWCWDCETNGNKQCGPGDVRT